MIEEAKRQEFNERRKMRQTQASSVFESNQDVKQTVKAEREKIKALLESQKKEAFDEKQKMYLKMKHEQEVSKKRKSEQMAQTSRVINQKIETKNRQALQVEQETRELEAMEQKYLQNLQHTYNKEKEAAQSLRKLK